MNELENTLLELCSLGDVDGVTKLLDKGVSVNYTHPINGWSSLHWAAKRGHGGIVKLLLDRGADEAIVNSQGQTALEMATDFKVRTLLGDDSPAEDKAGGDKLPITPNYLRNPEFPHHARPEIGTFTSKATNSLQAYTDFGTVQYGDELVLKVRIFNAAEKDFIEIELPKTDLTFRTLLDTVCDELEVDKELVVKVRKLPDTIIRKDKDVQRLLQMQELELVLSNKHISESSRNYRPAVQPRSEHITY